MDFMPAALVLPPPSPSLPLPSLLLQVKAMAAYFHKRINSVVAAKGEEHWQRVLEIEFGGMNDVRAQEGA